MVRVRVGAGVRAWTMHATPDPQPQPGAGARHPVTGRPHGYGEWRDDSYHGECDGMVDSCPPPLLLAGQVTGSGPLLAVPTWLLGGWHTLPLPLPLPYPYPYPTPGPNPSPSPSQVPAWLLGGW